MNEDIRNQSASLRIGTAVSRASVRRYCQHQRCFLWVESCPQSDPGECPLSVLSGLGSVRLSMMELLTMQRKLRGVRRNAS